MLSSIGGRVAHVNKVMNQIVRRDLGADLIHARENSNFRGVSDGHYKPPCMFKVYSKFILRGWFQRQQETLYPYTRGLLHG